MSLRIMAFESIEEIIPLQEDSIKTNQFNESLQSSILEVDQAQAQIQSDTNDIEKAIGVASVLSKMQSGIEQTIPDGGLSPVGAAAIAVAVEELKTSIGYAKAPAFALEGFSDPASRIKNTKMALEGIKDIIKKIWNGIFSSISKAGEWIKSYFEKILKNATAIQFKANYLLRAATRVIKEDVEEPPSEISFNPFFNVLNIDGKVPTPQSLITKYKESNSQTEEIRKKLLDIASLLHKKVYNSVQKDINEVELSFDLVFGKSVKEPKTYTVPKEMMLTGYDLVFGGLTCYGLTPKDRKNMTDTVKGVTAFVSNHKDLKNPNDEKIMAMTAEQMKTITPMVSKVMAAYINEYRKIYKAITAFCLITKKLEDLAKDADSSDSKTQGNIEVLGNVTYAFSKIMSDGMAAIESYDLDLGTGILNYSMDSLQAIAPKIYSNMVEGRDY